MEYKMKLAICLKTYPDEDDMQMFCDGDIDEPSDVRVYLKGEKYKVNPEMYNENYYKLIE